MKMRWDKTHVTCSEAAHQGALRRQAERRRNILRGAINQRMSDLSWLRRSHKLPTPRAVRIRPYAAPPQPESVAMTMSVRFRLKIQEVLRTKHLNVLAPRPILPITRPERPDKVFGVHRRKLVPRIEQRSLHDLEVGDIASDNSQVMHQGSRRNHRVTVRTRVRYVQFRATLCDFRVKR
jgi:hypothetical protein